VNAPAPFATADYLPEELIQAFAERPLDHENDQRPDAAFDVARIMALSDAELADLRGEPCPQCKDRDCLAVRCEICDRHSHTLIEIRPGVSRLACTRCAEVVECANFSETRHPVKLERCKMALEHGERFCPECSHRDPTEGL